MGGYTPLVFNLLTNKKKNFFLLKKKQHLAFYWNVFLGFLQICKYCTKWGGGYIFKSDLCWRNADRMTEQCMRKVPKIRIFMDQASAAMFVYFVNNLFRIIKLNWIELNEFIYFFYFNFNFIFEQIETNIKAVLSCLHTSVKIIINSLDYLKWKNNKRFQKAKKKKKTR